jgi:hypothetical protein
MVNPRFFIMASGGGLVTHQARRRAPTENAMRETAKYRAEIIEHLEQALLLCEQASEPIVGYLIERALDEVRGSDWTGLPKAPR